METTMITLDRDEALKMLRKYKEHRAYQTPIDHEIEQIYRLITRGKVVIKALESVVQAGVDEDGLPKLALVRADAAKCFLQMSSDGSARFSAEPVVNGHTAMSKFFSFPPGSFIGRRPHRWRAEAIVPHIPPDIRPKRGIQNYHILFEAIWEPTPPIDPLLLRRIGKGDTWLVVGAWNLTEVERAVIAGRIVN